MVCLFLRFIAYIKFHFASYFLLQPIFRHAQTSDFQAIYTGGGGYQGLFGKTRQNCGK